jgi:hypothetical protein
MDRLLLKQIEELFLSNEIKAIGLIKSRALTGHAKYYLQLRIGDTVRKMAESLLKGGSASWNEDFCL